MKIFANIFCFVLSGFLAISGETTPQKPPTNEYSYNDGIIKYKDLYSLFVYPTFYKLPDEKKYIKSIFQAILLDRLQIAKSIVISNPKPEKITYPPDNITEDPRETFLSGNPPKPERFDLQIKPVNKFPEAIIEPKLLLDDSSQAEFFMPEDLHLLSSIENKNDLYLINIRIFRNGNLIYEDKMTSLEIDISKNILNFAGKISSGISGVNTGILNISSNIEKSSVYLNEQYMGYAPLEINEVPVGENDISVRKDGYITWSKPVSLSKDQKMDIVADMQKEISTAELDVSTQQEKCDVYMDAEYRGQAPVTIKNILPGFHRIRITKDGFIDNYQSIKVDSENTKFHIFAKLIPGKSTDYYNLNRKAIGPYTFEQLYKASIFSSMFGGLGGLFFEIQRQNAQSNISLYNYKVAKNGYTLTSRDLEYYAAYQKNIPVYTSLEIGFLSAGAVCLLSAIYFYIRYVDSQDLKVASLSPSRQNILFQFQIQNQGAAFSFSNRW
ncbi:MAG: PEGA domain-containing protein [Spirochaetia bacterium]|nr:PEGA domain-containing protein [Spirochaetia bacterium]